MIIFKNKFLTVLGGFGEGHASSDEEELADDADATEARYDFT